MILALDHRGRLRTISKADRCGNYHVFRHTWEVSTPFELWKMATEAMALGATWDQVEPFFTLCQVNPCFPWDYADASQMRLYRSTGKSPEWFAVGKQLADRDWPPMGRGRNPISAMANLKRSLLDGTDFAA